MILSTAEDRQAFNGSPTVSVRTAAATTALRERSPIVLETKWLVWQLPYVKFVGFSSRVRRETCTNSEAFTSQGSVERV